MTWTRALPAVALAASAILVAGCYAVELGGLPCDEEHPCLAGYACVAGACRDEGAQCVDDEDCADDERCQAGGCVPIGQVGQDGGAPGDDAGPDDAGPRDAGPPPVDAGACVDPDGDLRGPGCEAGDDCDPDDADAYASVTGFRDGDGDTYTLAAPETLCTDGALPDGYAAAASAEADCDDGDAALHAALTGYRDLDGDGIASPEAEVVCTGGQLPPGYAAAPGQDNCPNVSNVDQADGDDDDVGDVCDNCISVANADQADLDQDQLGDACDADADGDGADDATDVCPGVADPLQQDGDGDGVGDLCDVCPADFDPAQEDVDGDGQGDACDADLDGDGVANDADLCPFVAEAVQHDEDADGVGDACDNCPATANPDQSDLLELGLGDGVGDACDPRPTLLGDRILFFDGFGGAALDPAWVPAEVDDLWSVAGDALVQAQRNDSAMLTLQGLVATDVVVELRGAITELQGGGNQLGVLARSPGPLSGDACLVSRDGGNQTRQGIYAVQPQGAAAARSTEDIAPNAAIGSAYVVRFDVAGGDLVCTTTQTAPQAAPPFTSTLVDADPPSGSIAIFTNQLAGRFESIVVYGRE